MNPAAALKGARLLFRFRKVLALAVILEFAVRRRMNAQGKKSKKQNDVQLFAEQNIGRAQHLLQDLKRQYVKR